MEVAYQKISASDADRMLNISNQAVLRDYAAKVSKLYIHITSLM